MNPCCGQYLSSSPHTGRNEADFLPTSPLYMAAGELEGSNRGERECPYLKHCIEDAAKCSSEGVTEQEEEREKKC